MNAKKWNALLTAVRLGSFSKAAEALDYTQSGITHMMNSLEEQVGFPLLQRRWDGVRLTEEGEALLPAIQAVVDSNEELQRQLALVGSGRFEQVCIGTYASVSVHWLAETLARLHREMPNTELELRIGSRQELTDWLAGGSLQLALADRLEVRGADWIPLYDDPLLAVLPASHPAAAGPVFDPSALEDLPMLAAADGAVGGNQLRHFLPGEPDVHISTEDEGVLLSMIRRGVGFSIMSELCIRDRTEGVAVLPLPEPMCRHLGLTRLDTAPKSSPAVRKLLQLLQEARPDRGGKL